MTDELRNDIEKFDSAQEYVLSYSPEVLEHTKNANIDPNEEVIRYLTYDKATFILSYHAILYQELFIYSHIDMIYLLTCIDVVRWLYRRNGRLKISTVEVM